MGPATCITPPPHLQSFVNPRIKVLLIPLCLRSKESYKPSWINLDLKINKTLGGKFKLVSGQIAIITK